MPALSHVFFQIRECTCSNGGDVVAEGSSRQFGYRPTYKRSDPGVTVGSFRAESGRRYTLAVSVNSTDPRWELTRAYIDVTLDRLYWGKRMLMRQIGFLLFPIGIVSCCLIGVAYVLRKVFRRSG